LVGEHLLLALGHPLLVGGHRRVVGHV
jgi:hypothetical protein